jgi:hypothetical protein
MSRDLSHLSYYAPGEGRRQQPDYEKANREAQNTQRYAWALLPECWLETARGRLRAGDEVLESDVGRIEDLVALRDEQHAVFQLSSDELRSRNLPPGEPAEFIVAPGKAITMTLDRYALRGPVVSEGAPMNARDFVHPGDPSGSAGVARALRLGLIQPIGTPEQRLQKPAANHRAETP